MTTATRLPGMNPSFTPDDTPFVLKPVDGMFTHRDGNLTGTFICNGQYFSGYVTPPYMPLSEHSVLTIQTEATFQMLRHEQALIGEHARDLDNQALHSIMGQLLAGQVGGVVTAGAAWTGYAEDNHLSRFAETNAELFKHRRAFAIAWHKVGNMIAGL